MRSSVWIVAVVLALVATGLFAHDHERERKRQERSLAYARQIAARIASTEALSSTLLAANERSRALDESALRACDTRWRARDPATLSPVLESPGAALLRAWMTASHGALTQVMVMDARGLLVLADRRTGDCWQGDEAQFREVFPRGSAGLYVDRDQGGSHRWVSVAIERGGQTLGALTVGIDADRVR